MVKKIIREWVRTKEAFWHDSPNDIGYGKILSKIVEEKFWQKSDYDEPNHPFYELVRNTKEKYNILSSFYFNTQDLRLLLKYFEKDLEEKMQILIDNPPVLEPDNPFYGESFEPETVIFKDKILTMDLIIYKEFREVWGLSKTVKSLQEEINLNGGLYLIYAECLEDKNEI